MTSRRVTKARAADGPPLQAAPSRAAALRTSGSPTAPVPPEVQRQIFGTAGQGGIALPSSLPESITGPPELEANDRIAVITLGTPLRYNRASSLFIDDPLFQELRGPRADRTMQRMLADPIMAGAVERTGLLLRGASWAVTPGGDAPIDKAFADFVNENIEGLETGWRSTVANFADAVAWGFALHETLFTIDGNAVRWADFSPREQRSVRSWYVDPGTARLRSVVQQTDRGLSVPIPSWKLVHFRTHPASGRPEGRSLMRNAFIPWTDKQELRRITKLGLRRDFTGVGMMEVPAAILSSGATPNEKAALAQAESLVRDFERDEREGIVVPSASNKDGTNSGWKFSLVTSGGRRQVDFESLWSMFNREMLIALLSEYILLGLEKVGTQALAGVKANMFGRATTSWLDLIAEMMAHKVVPVLQAFNLQFAAARPPIWTHGDIDEVTLSDLGTFLQAVSVGGYVTPDPELEAALRKRAGLPTPQTQQEL
jgi:hypothetical protein